jgi:citrate lyase subunit beta / citryl-CoA lyase
VSAAGPAWLFCPADRPERYAKAAARADVVILDLEDGVASHDRVAARQALIDQPLDPSRTVVRISPVGTDDHVLDLNALAATAYQQVMLAKTESGADASSAGGRAVIALCETPLGVLNAPDIARAEHVHALMWGAEDLTAALGGRSSRFPDGRYRDFARYARSTVLLAAAVAGRTAIDSVYLDIADLDGLAAESADAVESGFAAKACIHPSQVDVVRRAFRPSAAEVSQARRILAAAAGERGVFALDGQMVDEPVLRQARRTVAFDSDQS